MYIQPNTDVVILKTIPLNKSYENTVYYSDKNAQYNAFIKYKKYSLANYSYQRVNTGTLRVELKYENLYDCNYLMFKNTSFENKWFYAFITGVSYISNDVSEIYFEIDVMQTWCYDYEFMRTFVERHHATQDTIYSNTQPEGLELGPDYVTMSEHGMRLCNTDYAKRSYMILATTTQTGGHPTPSQANGMLSALVCHIHSSADSAISEIKGFIDNGYEDNIVAIYTVPDQGNNPAQDFTRVATLDGYTPRNKKLYCYPFCFMLMSNNTGATQELKYENFYINNMNAKVNTIDYHFRFSSATNYFPTPSSTAFPLNYLESQIGHPNGSANLLQYTLTYSQFPTGAIAGDSFKVWLAQNKNSYGASLNAIQSSYDTNVAIANNNFAMATRSANASASQAIASADTGLANAIASNNTSLAINDQNQIMNTVQNVAGSAGNVLGNLMDLNVGGAVSSAISGVANQAKINLSADQARAQLATSLSNSNRSASTAISNTQLGLSTALKNASTAQASANLSALTSAQNATAQLVAKKQDASHQPSSMHGQMMNDMFNSIYSLIGFTIFEKSIKSEYAQMIDMYFDKYGYARRLMYIPRRLNRPHWSYLKTVGCQIKGNLNNADILTIQGIYDNGITTWDTLENVCNYTLDNRVQ